MKINLTNEEKILKKKEYDKNWREKNRDYHKKWALKNPIKYKEYHKKYNNNHKDKRKEYWDKNKHDIREYRLLKKYGINNEQYNSLIKKQNNKCAICNTQDNNFRKKLSVDHDHKTGKIRGLLCYKCNLILGNANDSIEILNKAKKYLKKIIN